MNKQKSVILSIALLSALSAGITADAREGLRLSTDPKLTEKAIEAQMKQSVSAKEVNFDNMLLQKNLNDMMPEGKVKAETSNIDIDLKGAVSTAIQNNRDIRLAELSLEQAETAVSQAAAAKNPSLSYKWARNQVKAGSANSAGFYGANHGYNQGLTLSWPIWTGGAVEGAIDAARYAEDVAHINVYQTEAATKLAAAKAYYQYLEMIKLADVAMESVTNLDGHLTNVKQQYDAGVVAKLDVLSSNVSLANAKQNSIAAANSRDIAEANLNNIMRLPMNTKLNPIDKDFPEPTFDITLEQAIAMGQKYRWELIKADYNVRIAKEQVRIAKAGYMPTVAVGGGYSWNTAGLGGLDKDDWTVTGTVSWSIWDGGTTDAKIKSASSGLKSAEETLLKARESIELEIRQDYLNILSAREQIRATEAAVEQAEEAYKIATVRYRSGVGINFDVLDAQLALNKARTNHITALYNYNVGLATLENAMGIPAVIHPEFTAKK